MRGHSGRWAGRAAIALVAAALALPAQAAALPQASDSWQGAQAVHAEPPARRRPAAASPCRTSSRSPRAARPVPATGVQMASTMWWYVVGTGGDIVFSTDFSTLDSMLAVYAGTSRPPTPDQAIGCWDDNFNGGQNERIRITGTAARRALPRPAGPLRSTPQQTPCARRPADLAAVTNDQRAFPAPATAARAPTRARARAGEPTSCKAPLRRDRLVPLDGAGRTAW